MNLNAPLSVLLIEDQDEDAELLLEAVRAAGIQWNVRHVRDGEEALHAMKADPAHLIITDLRVQGMDGYTLLAELHREDRWPNTPVIVLSGTVRDVDRQRGLNLRASDVVLKPDSFQGYLELLRALDEAWGPQARAAARSDP